MTRIDADVIIPHLRGDKRAKAWLKKLLSQARITPCIGALQRAEILFFAHSEHVDDTVTLLNRFLTDPITEGVGDDASEIFHRFRQSHGTGFNDALLAAQVIRANGRLATCNRKHFPMRELRFEATW